MILFAAGRSEALKRFLVSRGEQTRTGSVVSKAGHFCATRCSRSSPRPVLEEAGA
jgi:hypothetical protein